MRSAARARARLSCSSRATAAPEASPRSDSMALAPSRRARSSGGRPAAGHVGIGAAAIGDAGPEPFQPAPGLGDAGRAGAGPGAGAQAWGPGLGVTCVAASCMRSPRGWMAPAGIQRSVFHSMSVCSSLRNSRYLSIFNPARPRPPGRAGIDPPAADRGPRQEAAGMSQRTQRGSAAKVVPLAAAAITPGRDDPRRPGRGDHHRPPRPRHRDRRAAGGRALRRLPHPGPRGAARVGRRRAWSPSSRAAACGSPP